LPVACFNQYNVAVSPPSPDSFDSDIVAELNAKLRALQRTLGMRGAELEDAHHHIAGLEEKLLKLKEYRRELKRLKEERQRLRKSAERRVGEILLAPYRLPTGLAKTVWRRFNREREKVATTEYQKWFEQHQSLLQSKSFSRTRRFLARTPFDTLGCHVERSETSRLLCRPTGRNDQRFFASLRMTSVR
jgi:hypothetical protein